MTSEECVDIQYLHVYTKMVTPWYPWFWDMKHFAYLPRDKVPYMYAYREVGSTTANVGSMPLCQINDHEHEHIT